MTATFTEPTLSGETLYARPSGSSDPVWANPVVPGVEVEFDSTPTGVFGFDLVEPGHHTIHRQEGGSPAFGDPVIGTFPATAVPTGQHAVTVTVDDTNSELVEGARVRLTDTSGTPTGVRGTSGTLGVAELSADDGDYEVRVSPPTGYQTPDPVPITVDGGPVPVTVTLTAVSIPPAPEPQLCTVRVRVRDQFGVPIVGATVTALIDQTRIAADAMLINSGAGETTDADGNVDLTLFRNTEFAEVGTGYTIRAVVGNRSAFINFVVPDAPTANATLVV